MERVRVLQYVMIVCLFRTVVRNVSPWWRRRVFINDRGSYRNDAVSESVTKGDVDDIPGMSSSFSSLISFSCRYTCIIVTPLSMIIATSDNSILF